MFDMQTGIDTMDVNSGEKPPLMSHIDDSPGAVSYGAYTTP